MKQTEFKRKACLLNLTHNENSSKNINISINYNLGSPKPPECQSLKGKKIDRMVYPIKERSSQLIKNPLKQTISGCEVSVKLVKKKTLQKTQQKSLIKSRTGKIQKPKRRIDLDFPMSTTSKQNRQKRLFTQYEDNKINKEQKTRFNKSTDHIRTKSQPRVRADNDLIKKMKKKEDKEGKKERERAISDQKPKRIKHKSFLLDRNKTQIELKDKSKPKKKKQRQSLNQIPKPIKKKQEKEKQSLALKKSKKTHKKRFFSHLDFQPFLISKILNSSVISDQIQPSEMNSKEQTQRKSVSRPGGETINVFKNTNSIELVPINEIRRLQREAKLKPYADEVNKRFNYDKAANAIKQSWKEYHRNKIMKYYNSVFEKNSKQSFMQSISEIKQQANQQQSPIINHGKQSPLVFEKKQFQDKQDSPVQQEDYFDIKKYQKMVRKTLEQDLRQKQQSKSSSIVNSHNNSPRPRKQRPQQIEQWNNINKLLNSQFSKGGTDSNSILNELLMKQSQINRQWIEDGSPDIFKQKIQEDKSAQNDKYQKKDQKQPEQKVEFHSKTYDFQQGVSSRIEQLMNMELMDNSESEGNIGIVHRIKNNDQIDNYLDCGLERCGLKNILQIEEASKKFLNDSRNYNKKSSFQQQDFDDNQNQLENPSLFFQPVENYLLPDTNIQSKSNDFQSIERYNGHIIFEQFYNLLIDQMLQQIGTRPKVQRMVKRYMKKVVAQIQSKFSIKTSLPQIKTYIEGLIQFVLNNNQEKIITLKNINCTLGPTSSQMLYYLRLDDYDVVEEEDDKQQSLFVISLDTFQRYEQLLDLNQKVDPRQQMYEHFWHRALFEGLNEALDQHRPYGTYGKPYDWQVIPKLNGRKIFNQQLESHLRASAEKLLQVADYLGGIMAQKQDSPLFGIPFSEQDYEQHNQERVSRILADELMQQQETWINYSDQKVQIQLQMLQLIQQSVFLEVGRDLKKIQLRRAFTSEY